MAKLETKVTGNFHIILSRITSAVMSGSVTATLEDSSDFGQEGCRCAVRVFERYSSLGGNRVSLNITLFERGDELFLSAISSGGSQGMFIKMNTFGESSFLDTIRETVREFL